LPYTRLYFPALSEYSNFPPNHLDSFWLSGPTRKGWMGTIALAGIMLAMAVVVPAMTKSVRYTLADSSVRSFGATWDPDMPLKSTFISGYFS